MSGRKLRAANHALTTTNRRSEESRREIRGNLGQWHRCAGVAAEEPPSWREAARERDMKREADEQGYTACRSKQHLLAAMVVGVIRFRMGRPRDGAHSGCGYGLEDGLVRDFTFVGGDRHTAIQDIESKPILAADERPNGLLEDRNFFCAIKPTHLIGTVVSHCGDIATREQVTLSPD